jgi:hypothetical protein
MKLILAIFSSNSEQTDEEMHKHETVADRIFKICE